MLKLLAFLVIVTYSKHLHIGLAPVNVLFSRRPDGLGPLEPMRSNGRVLDFEEADPDTDVFGVGKIEDFTSKGLLDLGTCTECGRCQSQCPAWATGKPLSPKQVILNLRDHAFDEALALDPDTVSTACPYCMVMLGDAVNAKKATDEAKQRLEIIDVAQLLVRSIWTGPSESAADRSVE
jgi:ferredoxin